MSVVPATWETEAGVTEPVVQDHREQHSETPHQKIKKLYIIQLGEGARLPSRL
jgi:hypothetical protein